MTLPKVPELLAKHRFGDTNVLYLRDPETGIVGMELFPAVRSEERVSRRWDLSGEPEIDSLPGGPEDVPRAWHIDPLAHVKIVGEVYSGAFAQGRTMRNAPGNAAFAWVGQTVDDCDGRVRVATSLERPDGCRIQHCLSWHEGDEAAEVTVTFYNGSGYPVTLELLTSFSLGGITPFAPDDAAGRLRIHRFRSVWSAEGRPQTDTLEALHLERSWSGAGLFSERFGQVGTMPVRGWFPFAAIEDVEAGVVWGAHLAWAGSWQMEVSRTDDPVCLSGGLADREFGHWTRTLAPGETLVAPPATIACAEGDLDALCDKLTAVQRRAADAHPAIEQGLPIVFNEWCTTWGDPSHAKVTRLAERLRGSDVRYLVIDAGWYKGDKGFWGSAHGDWTPSRNLFPNGIAATAQAIRDAGLIPGLWFEMETVGEDSEGWHRTDLLLKRDGVPVTVRQRRFWDLNNDRAVAYLTERVIGLLEACGFGYLKVDYNETLGLGCEGAESLGEGLRQQVEGIYRFFDQIRKRLPNLVIESCSSGGHRLEPSMLARSAMSSFSDAHELVEIPIIAANLHRLMLPRQSQIWAVIHPADSDRRLAYSLAATFLGRMCLSGDIYGLSTAQWAFVQRAMTVYRQAAPVIKDGTSRRYGPITHPDASWRRPKGWQAVVRQSHDQTLVVLHAFAEPPPQITVALPAGRWTIMALFDSGSPAASVHGCELIWNTNTPFDACVVLLSRSTPSGLDGGEVDGADK